MVGFLNLNGRVDYMSPEGLALMARVCPHEIGHLEVASYFNLYLRGIVWIELSHASFQASASYRIPPELSIATKCLILAAGSAGEVLELGDFKEEGASVDRKRVQTSGYLGSYETLVKEAVSILTPRRKNFDRLVTRLKQKVASDEILEIKYIPEVKKFGAYLLNADEVTLRNEALS